MWTYPESYDVIIVGAGHAGCEAAYAAATIGAKTLMLTMNLDTIGKMSCNPAIGGVGKGHIVREIDALGGIMGKIIDRTGIQFRMLNYTKGPAVWAPRAQADKVAYQNEVKHVLEQTANLEIKQGTIESLIIENGIIVGVDTLEGIRYLAKTVVISSGTFMRGLLHIGETNFSGGRAGDKPSVGLSASLEKCGFTLGRLKTGTPPRVNKRSIDLSLAEEQPGEEGIHFSFDPDSRRRKLPQISCYITYTTSETKKIIERNKHRSPMYSGKIVGVGPRYCPSIEDKIFRFAEREKHQLFLEPEGIGTEEVYINGLSSSLPFDVQMEVIHSIPCLANAKVMRPAYAIEYDYVTCGQIDLSLETRLVQGLFFAGQINGTSGYEEAGAQGLVAGINAANRALGRAPLILKSSESYIGVMVNDLVTKELDEPYRMFTSRAEHRLSLRQDNADLRLRRYGYEQGLVDEARYQQLLKKEETIQKDVERLNKIYKQVNGKGISLGQLLARPEITYKSLLEQYPDDVIDHSFEINQQLELHFTYKGYLERQKVEISRLQYLEDYLVPADFDFNTVVGLGTEAKQKLTKLRPMSLAQAQKIQGVSPADLTILMVTLKKNSQKSVEVVCEEPDSCC